MHEDPNGRIILKKFGADKFITTTDSDYAGVYEYTNKIGLNLPKYDYINE